MYNQNQIMEFVNKYLDTYNLTTFPAMRLASVSVFSEEEIVTVLEQLTDRVKMEEYIPCSRCNFNISESKMPTMIANNIIMCACGNHINSEIDKKKRYIKLA